MEGRKGAVRKAAISTPVLVLPVEFAPSCEDSQRTACGVSPFDDAVALAHRRKRLDECFPVLLERIVERRIEAISNAIESQLGIGRKQAHVCDNQSTEEGGLNRIENESAYVVVELF